MKAQFNPNTLVDLLQWRASTNQDGRGYTFLHEGSEQSHLSYLELDRRARAIAGFLRGRAAAGERALLQYDSSAGFICGFFGCLYAGIIAVPAYPPRAGGKRTGRERVQAIARDAQVSLVLTTSSALPAVEEFFKQSGFAGVQTVATDVIDSELATGWNGGGVRADDIAFLQYTSGSTSSPKGVMVTHANLLHNERAIQKACEHDEASTFAGWLPLYHDMGLIGNVLQPLFIGSKCVLMSPSSFLQSPVRWLRAISHYRAHTSGGPNFAYELCVQRIPDDERAGLDLSSWAVAFNGAEPVRPETIDRFAHEFEPYGFRREAFYPCYGLAEASLIVTGGDRRTAPTVKHIALKAGDDGIARHEASLTGPLRGVVGCGPPVADTTVLIVDPETRALCPPETVGEVWVSGPGVACGYWGKAENTDQTFRAMLSKAEPPHADRKQFLRTGDLGLMIGGELFITGRLQDLIIIRGQNHHPEDIEWTVQNSPLNLSPGAAAAFSVDLSGEERLVIIVEARCDGRADAERIARVVRQEIADNHELQVHTVAIVKSGTIPKTSSGKIQRHACRKKFLAEALDIIAASTLEEEHTEDIHPVTRETILALAPDERGHTLTGYLQRRLSRMLRVPLPDPHQLLNSLGLDSLLAIELNHHIQSGFGISAPLSHLLGGFSIARLASWILEHLGADMPDPLRPAPIVSTQEYPLSFGQRALWFIYQMQPESPAYNIARALRIRGQLDTAALRRALQSLVTRHTVLRNTFAGTHEGPIQRAVPDAEVWLLEEDATTWTEEMAVARLTEEANRPFDLERGQVMRAHVFHRSPGEQLLLLSVHHIVADLWSFGIILRDLDALYNSHASTELPGLLYADYVGWQADFLSSPEGAQQARFWESALSGDLPELDLPADAQQHPVAAGRGARVAFRVPADLLPSLNAACRSSECTLFTLLLSVFEVLLHRYSGQEEILIATPSSGRDDSRWAEVVGYFTNLVVLKSRARGNMAFKELLDQTRQAVLAALEHDEYPFPLVVERLQPNRERDHSPLVRVALAFQKAPSTHLQSLSALALGHRPVRMRLGGLDAELIPLEQGTAQFDLMLMLGETDSGLEGVFEYSTALFRRTRIQRMADHFTNLLGAVIANAERRICELPLLAEAERRQLLQFQDGSIKPEPGERTLHQMFEEQAARTPHAVAVIANSECLTYGELNRRSNQLARHLRAMGARAEMRIGVCLSRSAQMLVALLGVLKAGSAYVPVDPDYPPDRIRFILRDSHVSILLTETGSLDEVPEQCEHAVFLDSDSDAIWSNEDGNIPDAATRGNLAYVIYTSGSTGPPKGVQITHANVTAFLMWVAQAFQTQEMAGALASSSICFDLSVFEIFGPLIMGGTVILAENVLKVVSLPDRDWVTLINTVPSLLAECLKANGLPACVRTIALAGEPFSSDLARAIHARGHVERVLNLYAPSETTTYSTWYKVDKGERESPAIGTPIGDTQVYILDNDLQLLPYGIHGELYIAGSGVTRGYLDRPDLTAARFIPNPFGSQPGSRMYKTGDKVFYREDGNLEFVGRIDRQIKLRGFRIEPGEIELVLSQHPGLSAAAVVMVQGERFGKALAAYLVASPGHTPDATEIRSFAADKLPSHMIPAYFIFLDALPLSSNGKLDVKALPPPSLPPDESRALVAPRTSLEQVLAERWAAFLGVQAVGIHENFFELGGHSLIATQLAWDLETIFSAKSSLLALLLKNPTVAMLGEAIRCDAAIGSDPDAVAEIFLQVQQFTEDEIESLARAYERSENGPGAH